VPRLPLGQDPGHDRRVLDKPDTVVRRGPVLVHAVVVDGFLRMDKNPRQQRPERLARSHVAVHKGRRSTLSPVCSTCQALAPRPGSPTQRTWRTPARGRRRRGCKRTHSCSAAPAAPAPADDWPIRWSGLRHWREVSGRRMHAWERDGAWSCSGAARVWGSAWRHARAYVMT
jgi:hypothetical protein